MIRFFQRLLLRLPPETAHGCGILFLKLLQWIRCTVLKKELVPPKVLRIKGMYSIGFPNRVGLAAGFDKNAEVFAALGTMGFGFVEVGTVTPEPQEGNPKPRLFRKSPGCLVNHMGFNSQGLEHFRKNILLYRRRAMAVPVLANIGKNRNTPLENAVADYALGFKILQGCVDGFVVNLSSPNTPGLVTLQSIAFLEQVARACPRGLPVFIKLSPDLENSEIRDLSAFVAGCDRFCGLVLTNTSRKLAESCFGMKEGGLSGSLLFTRSLECVALAKEVIKDRKVIIGVGGISAVEDARKMFENGADLIEIYTAFIYQGFRLVREITDFCERK